MITDHSLPLTKRYQLMRWATYASVSVASVLISVKFVAWWITGSVSLQATLIDSFLDAFASLINLFAVRHAQQPADREHRFGHGKSEAIAALGQSIFISGSAFWLVYEAIDRFIHPVHLSRSSLGIWVMCFAIFATAGLIIFQIYVVRRTGSTAIQADSVHYQSDLIINMGVILSLMVTIWLDVHWFDPAAGLIIAIYILYTAWTIVVQAFDILMDRELPDKMRARIRRIAMNSDLRIKGIHDLRTRTSGIHNFIQLHLELDGNMTLYEAHKISDKVIQNIREAFPHTEVIIHEDPEDIEEKRDVFPENIKL